MRKHADILMGGAGVAAVLASAAILAGWPVALGLGGLLLIVIAVVMPPWA